MYYLLVLYGLVLLHRFRQFYSGKCSQMDLVPGFVEVGGWVISYNFFSKELFFSYWVPVLYLLQTVTTPITTGGKFFIDLFTGPAKTRLMSRWDDWCQAGGMANVIYMYLLHNSLPRRFSIAVDAFIASALADPWSISDAVLCICAMVGRHYHDCVDSFQNNCKNYWYYPCAFWDKFIMTKYKAQFMIP